MYNCAGSTAYKPILVQEDAIPKRRRDARDAYMEREVIVREERSNRTHEFAILATGCLWTCARYAIMQNSPAVPSQIRLRNPYRKGFWEKEQSKYDDTNGFLTDFNAPQKNLNGTKTTQTNARFCSKGELSAIILSSFILFEILFFMPVNCNSTVTTAQNSVQGADGLRCSPGCMCIFGQDSHEIMGAILKDNRQKETWERLKKDETLSSLQVLLCTEAGYGSPPRGLLDYAGALYFDNNIITKLSSSSFQSDSSDANVTLPTLLLSLSSNSISAIYPETFAGLGKLKTLNLRNNSISGLDWAPVALSRTPLLKELDLSMNKIDRVMKESFGNLKLLQRLDLSGNLIGSLDANVLSNLPDIEHLDLSSNSLSQSSFHASDRYTASVKFISLHHNLITDIRPLVSEFLNRFPNLEHLDLSQNQISSGRLGSKLLLGLGSLKTLNLSGCGISSLGQGWLNGGPSRNLNWLDLSHNSLTSVSAYALSVVYTADLYATRPGGALLGGSLFTDVDGITSQTGAFSFEFNKIPAEQVEWKWLRSLQSLITLDLSNNKRLVTIEDDTFDFVPQLKNLFLQDCAIRRLNIASVRNRYYSYAVAKTLPQLNNIWIYNNPLVCDCYVRAVKDWQLSAVDLQGNGVTHSIDATSYVMNGETVMLSVGVAMCSSPSNLAGKEVNYAPSVSMTCPDEPHSVFVAMMIGPLTFGASILLTIMCGSCHVFIMRMKKGAVLSYHAREEAMRTPRRKRRTAPDPIITPIRWSSVSHHDDTASPGSQRFRTNMVLSHMGGITDSHHRRHHTSNLLGVPSAMGASASSIEEADNPPRNRQSAGYCSGTDNNNQNNLVTPILVVSAAGDNTRDFTKNRSDSEIDSVLGKGSVRTRSDSSDLPFIDDQRRVQHGEIFLHNRSNSSESSKPPIERPSSACELSHPTTFTLSGSSYVRHRGPEEEMRAMLPDTERSRSYGMALPGQGDIEQTEEETCL